MKSMVRGHRRPRRARAPRKRRRARGERATEQGQELRETYTIVIVTHSMQQAARVSDTTAFFLLGELVEVGETEQVFTSPRERRTEDYITGRFG